MGGKDRKLRARKVLSQIIMEIALKVKELVWRKVKKQLGWTRRIDKADCTRHVCTRSGTDAHNNTDKWTYRAAGKRGVAMTAADADQQEAAAVMTNSTVNQLEADDAAVTREAGQRTGDKSEATREMTGGFAAEGAAAANTAATRSRQTVRSAKMPPTRRKKAEVRAARVNCQTRENGRVLEQ